MLGYEKVNKKRRHVPVATPSSDPLADSTTAQVPLRHAGWLVDLSVVATETPGESIARENEIVAAIARANDCVEQPSEHCIAEQLQGLIAPEVIRRH